MKLSWFENFLSKHFKQPVKVLKVGDLLAETTDELKGYGYGSPLVVEFEIEGEKKKLVFSTMRGDSFGHDFRADRVSAITLSYDTFNQLPQHVRAVDFGFFSKEGLISLKEAEEPFIVTEFVEGRGYFEDLEALKNKTEAEKTDKEKVLALSNYLAKIHQIKKEQPELYIRRIRDLVGHGEGIMGLIDNYPPGWEFVSPSFFEELEKKIISWRHRLKNFTHRLSQVHGDYHPWNILFHTEKDFWVLDRSRGEWGEPADDLTAMAINFLFFSLQAYQKIQEPFSSLFNLFISNYLEKTEDEEILKVCPPFFVWRALVVASPIWYPSLAPVVRKKLFNFINNILETDYFDYQAVNEYFQINK